MRPIQIIVSYRLQKDEEVFNHPCNSNLSKNDRIFGTLETINSLSLSLFSRLSQRDRLGK